jgi:hypothetical protein
MTMATARMTCMVVLLGTVITESVGANPLRRHRLERQCHSPLVVGFMPIRPVVDS